MSGKEQNLVVDAFGHVRRGAHLQVHPGHAFAAMVHEGFEPRCGRQVDRFAEIARTKGDQGPAIAMFGKGGDAYFQHAVGRAPEPDAGVVGDGVDAVCVAEIDQCLHGWLPRSDPCYCDQRSERPRKRAMEPGRNDVPPPLSSWQWRERWKTRHTHPFFDPLLHRGRDRWRHPGCKTTTAAMRHFPLPPPVGSIRASSS